MLIRQGYYSNIYLLMSKQFLNHLYQILITKSYSFILEFYYSLWPAQHFIRTNFN